MNQILSVQKNNEKKKNKSKINIDMKRMAFIISIIMIIFGITCIGKGAFAIMENVDFENKLESAVPQISIEQDGQSVIISVSHIKNIDSISYSWNNDETKKINGNNSNYVSEVIELPRGNNTLSVTALDVTGKKETAKKDFSIDTGKDIQKPTVEISVVGNYIKIVAKDDLELSYLTYRWNDEQEEIIHPTSGDNAKIETQIEIKRGQNSLTVIAVDAGNNTTKREEKFAGLTKPVVDVKADGDSLIIYAKHDVAIDRIEYTLNGQKYSIQYTPGPEMQYRQKMTEGYNKISVQAYSTDGTMGTFEGETTYTPAQ